MSWTKKANKLAQLPVIDLYSHVYNHGNHGKIGWLNKGRVDMCVCVCVHEWLSFV